MGKSFKNYNKEISDITSFPFCSTLTVQNILYMHLYGRTNLFWAQRALLVSYSFFSLLVAFVLQIQGGNLIIKHPHIKDYTTLVLVSMFQKQAEKFYINKDDLFVWNK